LGSGAKDDGGSVEPRPTPQQEERARWINPNDVAKLTDRLVNHPEIVDLLVQTSPSLQDNEGGGNSGHPNGEPYNRENIKSILSNVLVEDGGGRRSSDAATLEPPRDSGQTRGDRDVADAVARAFGRDRGPAPQPVPVRSMSGSGSGSAAGRMRGADTSFGSRSFNSAWRGRTLD
jgi:hypothetical protein